MSFCRNGDGVTLSRSPLSLPPSSLPASTSLRTISHQTCLAENKPVVLHERLTDLLCYRFVTDCMGHGKKNIETGEEDEIDHSEQELLRLQQQPNLLNMSVFWLFVCLFFGGLFVSLFVFWGVQYYRTMLILYENWALILEV